MSVLCVDGQLTHDDRTAHDDCTDCAVVVKQRVTHITGDNSLRCVNKVNIFTLQTERFLENIRPEMEMILLIAPPKMQLGEWVSTQHMIDSSVGLSLGYRRLCKRLDVPFVDATEWNVTLAFDGVHFSEEGHRVFAEGLANYLKEIEIC